MINWLEKVWILLTNSTPDFQWSLKPITLWFQLHGIRLDVSKKPSFCIHLAYGLVGFSALFLNFTIHYTSLYRFISKIIIEIEMFSNNSTEGRKQQLLDTSPIIFRLMVSVVFGTGPHLFFFMNVFLKRKWDDFWTLLLEVQRVMQLNKMFHKKIRRLGYAALGLIYVVSIHFISSEENYRENIEN